MVKFLPAVTDTLTATSIVKFNFCSAISRYVSRSSLKSKLLSHLRIRPLKCINCLHLWFNVFFFIILHDCCQYTWRNVFTMRMYNKKKSFGMWMIAHIGWIERVRCPVAMSHFILVNGGNDWANVQCTTVNYFDTTYYGLFWSETFLFLGCTL